MARTPLADALQRATAEVAAEERRLSRRDALKLGGVLGLATAAAAVPFTEARSAPAPGRRIVIVGGGLAGLTCAYELKQAGQAATVYEASSRVGGRSSTLRGAFADGQLVERGGQLIDQGHTAIRQLASRLGLQTDNLLQAEANGSEPLYYFDGQPYTYGQAAQDLNAIYQKLHRDLSAAGYPSLYNSFTPRGQQLDRMSILDWINESVPGGVGSKLGQLLEVAYTIEYGADAGQQSALNLLYLLGYSGQGQLRIFGPSNEKYAIRNGCDQVPTRLAAQLQGADRDRPAAGRRAPGRRYGHADPQAGISHPRGHRRQGGAGPAVLDPALFGRLLWRRVQAAQADRHPRARHGDQRQAPRPVHRPPLGGAEVQRRDLRRHRLPEHLGRVPVPGRPLRHPGQLHRRLGRGELRLRLAGVAGQAVPGPA